MSMELLVIDTGFQARNSDLQDKKSNWTALFRIVPASDVLSSSVSGLATWPWFDPGDGASALWLASLPVV